MDFSVRIHQGNETIKACIIELELKGSSDWVWITSKLNCRLLMGLLSFQRQLTRKRSRAGLQTKSTQHGMQPMLPPEGEHQCEAPGRETSWVVQTQRRCCPFHSYFRLQSRTWQGSKNILDLIQRPTSLISFPSFHLGVQNGMILRLLCLNLSLAV